MNAVLITVLKRLGFTRIQAQALDYLLSETKWPALTRDIEKGADLRQQEVNMVIRDFVKRGWLEEVKAPGNGSKGKPPFLYRFTLDKAALYRILKSRTNAQITELERLVKKDLNQALDWVNEEDSPAWTKPAMTQSKPASGESLPNQSSGDATYHSFPSVR